MQYVELSQCLSMSGNSKAALKFIRKYERKLFGGNLLFFSVCVRMCTSAPEYFLRLALLNSNRLSILYSFHKQTKKWRQNDALKCNYQGPV